jgi:hypothetical protein
MDILLLPGFMLDADLWSDMRPGLARLGHVVDADTTRDGSIEAMADRAVRSAFRWADMLPGRSRIGRRNGSLALR